MKKNNGRKQRERYRDERGIKGKEEKPEEEKEIDKGRRERKKCFKKQLLP